jgi:hypothetical protein
LSVLSVDLACARWSSVGIVSLELHGRAIRATRHAPHELGLRGAPAALPLAERLAELAAKLGARWILIDGPQAWKAPGNGLEFSRAAERALATPGKTGLPGTTRPAGFARFTQFSLELFDRLEERGWPRLAERAALRGPGRFALESFPTAAWRGIGLAPLGSKARARADAVRARLEQLRSRLALEIPFDPSHDELQALVGGLAGIALEGHPALRCRLEGIAPFRLGGHWREGFIVCAGVVEGGAEESQ